MNEQEFRENVIRLCNAGHKIEAIKLYRERTGKGLAEAKLAVEALARGEAVSIPFASSAPIAGGYAAPAGGGKDTVESYLRAGQKINAIKLYREATGLGLAEAKQAVEAMEAAMKRGEPLSALPPSSPPAMSAPARPTPFGASLPQPRVRKPFGEELPSRPDGSPMGLLALLALLLVLAAAAFAVFLFVA